MVGRRPLAVGVLALTLLSGCTNEIGGSAVSGPSSSRPAPTSLPAPQQSGGAGLLGELSTVDPCSLTDPGVFSPFGTATLGAPDSLDDCLVEIRTSDATTVPLYVGSLDRVEALPDLAGRPSTELASG